MNTEAAVLDGLGPSDYFLRLWRRRNKLLKSAKWMRTRCQLTACIARQSKCTEGYGRLRSTYLYHTLLYIKIFIRSMLLDGSISSRQESEWFSREYRVAILLTWSTSKVHYSAG